MPPRVAPFSVSFLFASCAFAATAPAALETRFAGEVRPFLQTYCIDCHGADKPEAELDLSTFTHLRAVVDGAATWDLVLERLEAGDMPPAKAKRHPDDATRAAMIAWGQALRAEEARKNAGDPGPVLARRLSNAEFDYTIHDLTGVDIRPTREFPVDPANQAGFANSGESLAMSPALFKKYLQAGRTVAEHLVLKPEGFEFAPHPVVADTDRDKWGVLRIVDFYRRQPTDLADYFTAAWRFQHRAALGQPAATLADVAAAQNVSPRYLEKIWSTLNAPAEDVGPIARLQALWRELPPAPAADAASARRGAEQMRDYVATLRQKIVPEVKNLSGPGMNNGSQTLVLWKNRQMAANRRTYDRTALYVPGEVVAEQKPAAEMKPAPAENAYPTAKPPAPAAGAKSTPATTATAATTRKTPAPTTPDVIRRGGTFLAPKILTTGSSATAAMAAARKRGADPELAAPADPAERARLEAAFARFADIFPDAFFISERARVYLDAQKEQENAGRLLSAGLHSMTGYFRDDQPLYDLILDDAGRRELDRLWREFEYVSSVPQRMHTSFVWFERTDSSYLRDPEFDPYRPEDKSVNDLAKIRQLGELYLAKAQRNDAPARTQTAIREHFELVAQNVGRVEALRPAAEASHLGQLETFAARAYRRPLSAAERDDLHAFYRASRADNGVDHEEAMRDCIARILVSPHFNYRIDLVAASASASGEKMEATGGDLRPASPPPASVAPLSAHALASRLSYFLWSSAPDARLLELAASGRLRQPEVLAAEARRLLQDPRARRLAVEFAGHWLDFRRFEEHNSVDRERYPAFNSALRSAMFEEPVRFLDHVLRDDRPLLDCLYADYTFVNAPLAQHYGVPAARIAALGLSDDTWTRLERAGELGRGGLLPMAVFLTANSPGLRTSPVKRGYWVVRRVLGERIPPPPNEVPELPADEARLAGLTLREALAKHREDKSCAACHARFDSFGLVFEGYGATGERRTADFGGRAVDTRAEFPNGREGSGVAGLRDYLRAHREQDFIDNVCRKLLAYALGRTLLMSDDPLIAEMKAKLTASGHRFSTLVEAIVTSRQFTTKRAAGEPAKTAAAR